MMQSALVLTQTSPLLIALRSFMKRSFLECLEKQSAIFPQEAQASLYLMGSTLFLRSDDRIFPFSGRKSEDLDLGVHTPVHSLFRGGQLREMIAPAIKKTVLEAGLIPVSLHNQLLTDDRSFAWKFQVYRDFSEEEAQRLLHSHFADISEASVQGVRIYLEIDINDSDQMTVLLPPLAQKSSKEGKVEVKRDDWRHFLAKILVRSMQHRNFRNEHNPTSFTPLDLINAYNILQSSPCAISLDPSTSSDIRLIRLLILVNLAIFGRGIEDIDVTSFDPSPTNVAAFRESLKGLIYPESDLTDDRLRDILSVFQSALRAIFSTLPHSGNPQLQLHLTPNEIVFFELAQGYRSLSSGGRQFPPPDPAIRVDFLDNDYGELFSQYPHLREAIERAPGLIRLGQRILERRQEAGY